MSGYSSSCSACRLHGYGHALVIVILAAKKLLVAAGDVKINVNESKELQVPAGGKLWGTSRLRNLRFQRLRGWRDLCPVQSPHSRRGWRDSSYRTHSH